MDRNQNNQGGRTPPQSGTDSRNLGNMDDDEERRTAQKGGESSSHEQDRDEQGQFAGSGSNRGGSTSGGSSSGGSNPGGSNR
jgi:hypothetical protein